MVVACIFDVKAYCASFQGHNLHSPNHALQQAQLLPGSKDGMPPLPAGVAALMASSSLDAVAAATAAAAAPPAPLPPPPQAGSSFGRLLQRMGFSSSTEAGGSSAAASRAAVASGRTGLLAIKDAPGAGHVLWAETAGD